MAKNTDTRIVVENVNIPGYESRVERVKYEAMKTAMLKVLPRKSPGLTQAEIRAAVVDVIDQGVFPGGEKVGWWAKCVQLDLEAKHQLVREATKPLRWYRC